jgi:hypothetical protein
MSPRPRRHARRGDLALLDEEPADRTRPRNCNLLKARFSLELHGRRCRGWRSRRNGWLCGFGVLAGGLLGRVSLDACLFIFLAVHVADRDDFHGRPLLEGLGQFPKAVAMGAVE